MRAVVATVLSVMVGACGCDPEQGSGAGAGGSSRSAAVPAYDGPELKATVETMESQPPQYALVVDVHVPTGGYALALASFEGGSNPREARFVLTSPAHDELVIQAFQHHVERVALGTDRTPVRVLVSQRQRRNPDAHRQPFQLAATVTPQ
jgi:hypothetical protein